MEREPTLVEQVGEAVRRLHAEDPLLAEFERDYHKAGQPRSVHEYLMWAYSPERAEMVRRARRRAVLHRYMGPQHG